VLIILPRPNVGAAHYAPALPKFSAHFRDGSHPACRAFGAGLTCPHVGIGEPK
jgi:hypothetical protein